MIVDASEDAIGRAAALLRAGRVVGIPTETVYGLAADASNADAVRRVFEIKGRPADHPLIVHIADARMLDDWAVRIPDDARRLAERFWPGPLTLILPRAASVLPEVTGGLETIALRVPAHPVALMLLEAFEGGLAAPSANRFGRVSPTTAEDVDSDLGGAVDLVIDGGRCEIGVESTIVAWQGEDPVIVRPGAIGPDEIGSVIDRELAPIAPVEIRAPGTLESHYSPATAVELCEPRRLAARANELSSGGSRVGILSLDPVRSADVIASWDAGGDMALFAHSLYRFLRAADSERLDLLLAALPPVDTALGSAVADRLRRAAHG